MSHDTGYSQNAGVIEISRNIYEQKKVLDYIFDMIVNNKTLVVDELMDSIKKTYWILQANYFLGKHKEEKC